MRIKTTATNIDLDLEEIHVSWDKKARKRNAVVVIDLPDGRTLEIDSNGYLSYKAADGVGVAGMPLQTAIDNQKKVKEVLPWERPHRNPYDAPNRVTFDTV